jgi:hypothetical protein
MLRMAGETVRNRAPSSPGDVRIWRRRQAGRLLRPISGCRRAMRYRS